MLATPNTSPLFVPRACSNRSSSRPRPMSRSPALTCRPISTHEGLSSLEPDAVQDSCAQVLDCSSGNVSGVGSGQSDNHIGTGYTPIMTHALLREWDRAQAPSSSAGRKAMLKRIFLAIFAGAGTPLIDAEQYWLESRVCHAISGDHIAATGSVDSALSFPHQGLSADETPALGPRRPRQNGASTIEDVFEYCIAAACGD